MSPSSRGAPWLLLFVAGCGSPTSSARDAADADAGGALDVEPIEDVVVMDVGADSERAPPDATAAACAPSGGGSRWAVWPIVDPAARTYDTSSDGVVVDLRTQLIWQRAAAEAQLTWDDARSYCNCLVLGGHDDWRLPTRIELLSIVDYRRADPSIDSQAFPATPDTWFWSASAVANTPGEAWYLSFMDGNTHEAAVDTMYGVRCVRGLAPARAPLAVAADTVLDPATHLTWQSAVDAAMRTWDEAQAYCAGLPLAGGGWRLPTMFELQTLVDESVTGPAIDATAFPDTPPEGFWAETPLASMPGYWFVSFDHGIAYNAVATHPYRVRCVR